MIKSYKTIRYGYICVVVIIHDRGTWTVTETDKHKVQNSAMRFCDQWHNIGS